LTKFCTQIKSHIHWQNIFFLFLFFTFLAKFHTTKKKNKQTNLLWNIPLYI
jgi:hypothetical protein